MKNKKLIIIGLILLYFYNQKKAFTFGALENFNFEAFSSGVVLLIALIFIFRKPVKQFIKRVFK